MTLIYAEFVWWLLARKWGVLCGALVPFLHCSIVRPGPRLLFSAALKFGLPKYLEAAPWGWIKALWVAEQQIQHTQNSFKWKNIFPPSFLRTHFKQRLGTSWKSRKVVQAAERSTLRKGWSVLHWSSPWAAVGNTWGRRYCHGEDLQIYCKLSSEFIIFKGVEWRTKVYYPMRHKRAIIKSVGIYVNSWDTWDHGRVVL